MPENVLKEALEKGRLNHETALIPWTELQRYFASGSVLVVSPALDIIDVAYRMSVDDKTCVKGWLDDQQLQPASDQQAKNWLEIDACLWAIVVRPWVLVQDRS